MYKHYMSVPYTTLFRSIIMVGSRGILLVSVLAMLLLAILKINNSMYRKRILTIGVGFLVIALFGLVVMFGLLDIDALKDRKSTRLNTSQVDISYAVFC